MSGQQRVYSLAPEVRFCRYCERLLGEGTPLFLITRSGGRTIGPFHVECAEVLTKRARRLADGKVLPGYDFGRVVEGADQQELPW